MKKIIVTLFLILLMIVITGCTNHQVFDTTYNFDRVIIKLPNGDVVDGQVQSWHDWENSDSVQVKINGVTYYTHLNNVVLIDE